MQYVNISERYGNDDLVTLADYREISPDTTFQERPDGIYEQRFEMAEDGDGEPFVTNVRWEKVAEVFQQRIYSAPMVNEYGTDYGTAYYVIADSYGDALKFLRDDGKDTNGTAGWQIDVDFGPEQPPEDWADQWDGRIQNPRS